jgi:hypothetical protein
MLLFSITHRAAKMKTPKVILFFLAFLYPVSQGHAQITINGNVSDNEFNPVNNALVQIVDEGNKSNFYSAYTDQNGNFSIYVIVSGVSHGRSKIPDNNIVLKNYPNPFNPSTIIYYELPAPGEIEIKIYDILGKEIRSLYSGFRMKGSHRVTWDGRNNWDSAVAAGIYLCWLKTKDTFRVHKMLLLDGGLTSVSNNFPMQKSVQNKIAEPAALFCFTIKVSEKYINPIELRSITCTGDTTLNLTATKPLVGIIGPEGGIFSNDEFYLSIPSSGFADETELRLYTMPDQDSPYEQIVSKTFRLEGIPEDYNQRLSVGLKYEGELNNESIVEFGANSSIPGLEDSVIIYFPSAAYDSAGFLWADYPPYEINQILKIHTTSKKNKSALKIDNLNNPYVIYVRAKSNTRRIETENFYGYLPEFAWNTPILNYLEISYNQYKNMGFTFQPDAIPLTGNKCNVITCYVTGYSHGPEEGHIFGTGQAYISRDLNNYDEFYRAVNVDFFWWLFLDDYPFKNRLQAISGIVLFDAISKIYDTKEVYDRRAYKNERLWFHKAVSFWAGELFTAGEDYIPPGFNSNELSPLHGMVAGAGTSDEKQAVFHGYGMTSLIKYLMEKAEYEGSFNTFLHDVYSKIFEDYHPAAALIKTMKVPPEIWFPEYLREYISGNIYNVPASAFLGAGEDDLLKIEIMDNTEFNVGFLREYNDLSAKLFRIDLKYNETKENNEIQFKPEYSLLTPTDAATLLFGLKNDKLEFLNGGIGTICCNIKNVQDQGYNTLLAAVVNNYFDPTCFDSNSEINLNIRIKEKDTLNYTIFKVSALANYLYYDGTTSHGIYLYNPGSGTARYGTFNNGIFESKWIGPYDHGCRKGSIKLTVDFTSTPPVIKDYSVQESVIATDKEETFIEGKNVNIPGYERSFGGYEFYITGNETCSKITTLENSYEGQGGYSWSIVGPPDCDNNSYIKIILGGE